jgi:hypothetical protein
MFRRLVRGRESLHTDLTVEKFESVCSARFDIVRTQHLNEESRWLYLLRKRNAQINDTISASEAEYNH